MKVILNDKEVKVSWKYDIRWKCIDQIDFVYTTCFLRVAGETMAYGTAELAAGERHNKQMARKISLTRALSMMPREQRTLVWKKYGEVIGFRTKK